MFHNSLIGLFRNHRCRDLVLGVDIVVEIRDDQGELLLRLLVEVRNGDTGSKNSVVRVGDGHVCRSLSSLWSGVIISN